jgi:hypothetical protein
MDISNNPSINKVDECIVHKLAIDGARVEDGEVGVFYARGIEVRVREGASV